MSLRNVYPYNAYIWKCIWCLIVVFIFSLVMNIKFMSLECNLLLNIEKQSRKTSNIDLHFYPQYLALFNPVHISYTNHIFKR